MKRRALVFTAFACLSTLWLPAANAAERFDSRLTQDRQSRHVLNRLSLVPAPAMPTKFDE